ncbi:D-alanyl-D-alanine carboxypeptidase family protein [Peribacillus sp. SCS-155]|uniref:D-alanyl-D-alanine carboxypeptidase family protein n=1 Tax=Peribacillus sedimenti TaxID=3115297 RepID=UPI0039065FA5
MQFIYKISPYVLSVLLLLFLTPEKAKADDLSLSAKSAILMEQGSGRVIFQKDANKKSRIASITKIMTAVLAAESGKMEETVNISSKAIGTEGSSLYLKHGQKMKLEDLVYGLMLRSGNDAAVAIAEYVGGSVEGFNWMMNQKAEEIGMNNTHFSNPHGLDNTKNHYSTAYDMALLTRYAMNNEYYRKITGAKVHRTSNSIEDWDYVWRNKNRLLTQLYKYCTGGKTGYTKLAKRTLVTTASKNSLDLIAVTLNASDDWNDHISMYESAFEDYQNTEILPEGLLKEVKKKPYKGKAYIKNSFDYPLNKEINEEEMVHVKLKLLKPSKNWLKDGEIPQRVGIAEIYLDNEKIGSRYIFYKRQKEKVTLSQPSLYSVWKKTFNVFMGI